MAKWIIPRHKPRRTSSEIKADINHGKRFKRKELTRIKREEKRKADEFRAYKGLADDGVEVAKVVLGACNRKKSLPLNIAKRCAIAAWIETGRRMFVYSCPYCGKYHITSHSEPGNKYVYDTDQYSRNNAREVEGGARG